jgi:hypothetical protein
MQSLQQLAGPTVQTVFSLDQMLVSFHVRQQTRKKADPSAESRCDESMVDRLRRR